MSRDRLSDLSDRGMDFLRFSLQFSDGQLRSVALFPGLCRGDFQSDLLGNGLTTLLLHQLSTLDFESHGTLRSGTERERVQHHHCFGRGPRGVLHFLDDFLEGDLFLARGVSLGRATGRRGGTSALGRGTVGLSGLTPVVVLGGGSRSQFFAVGSTFRDGRQSGQLSSPIGQNAIGVSGQVGRMLRTMTRRLSRRGTREDLHLPRS
jgi:hypothetical protein